MTRPKFTTRTIYLVGQQQLQTALNLLPNLPIDAQSPLEIVIREKTKTRAKIQSDLMWSGPLKDIEEQAWVNKRQYSAEVWHEHLKQKYLPEQAEEGITKDGYIKWDIDPAGDRILVGSTTQLTVKGFSIYLEQVYAFGAELGVEFSANPNETGK